jgi:endonuclease III
MKIQQKIRKILSLLNKAYGAVPPFKKTNPVDELVRTILSQNTNDKNSLKAYAVLKINFKSWDELLKTPMRKIARLIRHAGLANIKAARIKGVLVEIRAREGMRRGKKGGKGGISLSHLGKMSTDDAHEYLRSLKGVGPKTASCVLLFSFGKPVMPVDTHIFRVTKRLGLIYKGLTIEAAHKRLSAIVPKDLIYRFHLSIIEHGRKTCKAQNPGCGVCCVYGLCRFEKKKFYRKK